jgi:lysophospholipase L1-like esterase
MNLCSIRILAAASALAGSLYAHDMPPSSPMIRVSGTKYTTSTPTGLRFQRHREDVLNGPRNELGLNPDKARNTSGIVLGFQTGSASITARFRILSANYMGSAFGVFENGNPIDEFKFKPKATDAVLEFTSVSPGSSRFEIALPSFADVEFRGLDIDDRAALEPLPDRRRKIYVALGDSISHGVGQEGATHKTWPFLLSRRLDAELFNLAVGGAKISVPVARMLEDWDRIDLITILIGYNDLHFDGKTPETYKKKYSELLDAIRINHPQTRIYCITPLFTKKQVSEKTGCSVEQFRNKLVELVNTRQVSDKNLHLIEGDHITSEKNLRADRPEDPVHLGVEGAALLAEELAMIMKKEENCE